jgi:YVTN family beta-propeller protein
VKSLKLFPFRRFVLTVVAAMLVTLWPVLPPAAAGSVLTRMHIDSPSAVAVNPVTNEIYVTSAEHNTLMVIDGATDTVSRIIPVCLDPRAIGVNSTTGRIYVVGSEGSMSVVDEDTGSISTLNVGQSPLALAVDQAANKIYVVNEGSSNVTEVDGDTNNVSTINTTGTLLRDVAVNDATGRIYVAAGLNVIMVDPKTNLTTIIPTGGMLPRGLAVDPNTGVVYVADWDSNDVIAISNDAGASTFITGTQPIDVAVNPATDQIYVADVGSDDLTVIDGNTNHTTSIGLDSQPVALAVNPTTNKVYVLSEGSNSLIVVDGSATTSSPEPGANTPGAATNTVPANSSTVAGTPATQTISLTIGQAGYTVNGAVYTSDAAPLIYEGRTLVPIRDVATALGATVSWDAAGQKVTVAVNGKTIELWIGQGTAKVNGTTVPIDSDNPDVTPILAPPGRVMLPLRFISENLGCQVDWNPSLQEINLTYTKP